ncbi:hypothetical protein [Fictibacillus barbaricus]|uniref:Uncharacterized protein n=1 Tax=Fictibacillus barbaricus TaxID=182136 RepID=A0ABS2ZDW6_9BACL|nr:hypothetical protein [Fictibacillus barbaricus]MBN3544834.1 hypothetical protein [Fictibacillus barbaricus]GGB63711.1 hypothetical protein GCM10007199_32200 [Fictibacillus barbaricus]
MLMDGNIISGEFDEQTNEFSLQKVKHFNTESTINEKQLQALYNYLVKHQDEQDGQIITLYDQMLIRLSQEEINLLIRDLEEVRNLYE